MNRYQDQVILEPLLPQEERSDYQPPKNGKSSYGLAYQRLGNIVSDYSSAPSSMNVKSLQNYFLTSLYPEASANKVHQMMAQTNQDENGKLMSYDNKSVEELFRNLWKSVIRKKFIIIGILKALGILNHFITPFMLDLLTNNFKIEHSHDPLTIFGFWTVTSEQASWIYSA